MMCVGLSQLSTRSVGLERAGAVLKKNYKSMKLFGLIQISPNLNFACIIIVSSLLVCLPFHHHCKAIRLSPRESSLQNEKRRNELSVVCERRGGASLGKYALAFIPSLQIQCSSRWFRSESFLAAPLRFFSTLGC